MAEFEFELNKYKTIDSLCTEGKKLYLSSHNIQFKEVSEDKIIIPYESLIARFYTALEPYFINVELSNKQLNLYIFKPRLFCEDIYGTPELWRDLLNINNMVSFTEFNKQKFIGFPTNISDLLEELIYLNERELKSNKSRVEN